MLKVVLATVGLVAFLLVLRLTVPTGSTGPAAQGPTAGLVTYRDQAGLTVRVLAQLDAMHLLEAGSGNRAQILADNDAIKADCATIEAHQREAGLDEAGIANLRAAIRWADFQAADEALRRTADR